MKVEFHPAARDELIATVEYYEAALAGLGWRFRDATGVTVGRLSAHPRLGRAVESGARRLVIVGFPYDLVYRIRADKRLICPGARVTLPEVQDRHPYPRTSGEFPR